MTDETRVMEPVRLGITVNASPETAFRVFTEGMGDWWPLDVHSIGVEEDGSGAPETVIVEGLEGGRVYERMSDGSEADWGRVLAWEPPRRLVLEWKPNRSASPPTELEVTFEPTGSGTEVTLEHRGWERLGARAEEARAGYTRGWPSVLDLFKDAANSA
jgi:uncharacterized protein YndB with AHSA1/START domain